MTAGGDIRRPPAATFTWPLTPTRAHPPRLFQAAAPATQAPGIATSAFSAAGRFLDHGRCSIETDLRRVADETRPGVAGCGLRRDGPAGRGYARWFLGVRSQQSRTQRSSGLGPGACTPGPSRWLHLSGERSFAHSPPARGNRREDRMFVTGDHLPSMETGARSMTPLWFIAGDLPVLQTSFRRLFVTRMFIVVVSRGLIRARRRLR